ncbi:MAG: DUF1326 domain-containing protein [Nitrososphaeraceae archaeon]|nr:DUF1326 domain-containing protein [Nitrososphaeraceae archaeon]MDW0314713.1 DUF1326 domain-containing protein [Nitrososphaeraceae archaeon]MDW0334568.1 DUF1326 domain-containing protein [Nitrososphaeraceae archaeon]
MDLKAQQQQKKPSWKVHAYFLDACNCDWGCPCQFNANPTHGNCEGIAGYHIITGSYGTTVKLDGLNMALIASWPGPLHEGRGKASYYIDNRADERQFEALSNIITGRAGGGPFAVYASIIEEIQEPKKASVKFQTEDIRSRVTVSGTNEDKKRRIRGEQSKNVIAEAWLEPIRNPVTGKAHRAIIEIPEGFESTRMDQASMKTLVANDGYLSFRYEGTYGSFSENTWKGP